MIWFLTPPKCTTSSLNFFICSISFGVTPETFPPLAPSASVGTPDPASRIMVLVKRFASRKPNVISHTGLVICLLPGDMAIAKMSFPHSAKVPLWAIPPPSPRPLVSRQSTTWLFLPIIFFSKTFFYSFFSMNDTDSENFECWSVIPINSSGKSISPYFRVSVTVLSFRMYCDRFVFMS